MAPPRLTIEKAESHLKQQKLQLKTRFSSTGWADCQVFGEMKAVACTLAFSHEVTLPALGRAEVSTLGSNAHPAMEVPIVVQKGHLSSAWVPK